MKRFLIVITAVFVLTVNAKNSGVFAVQAESTESGDFDITNTSIISELVTPPTTISVTEGVTASKLTFKDKNNQTVVAFIIDTSYGLDDRLRIAIGTPNDGDAFGMQKVSAQAVSAVANGKNVVAAVNGDYYNTGTGEPIGILIKDGRKLHDSDKNEEADKYWVFLGIKNDGTAVCGGKSLFNSIESELFQAIGGRGSLVKNGELDMECIGTDAYGYKKPYPCTAAGIREDGSVFFVAVDGKRPSTYSAGITKDDLAVWMKDMGAVNAIALDGGGSTTAVIKNPENGQYVVFNSPSDKTTGPTGGTERAVANSIQVLRTVSDKDVGLEREHIRLIQDDAGRIPQDKLFGHMFANINRNILPDDMSYYLPSLKSGGILLLSGFFEEDVPALEVECTRNGLECISFSERNRWVAMKTRKTGNP